MINDKIIRANGAGLLVFAGSIPKTCDEASRRHGCSPVAAAAIGRTMVASALYCYNLKEPGSVAIKINGNGPAGKIVATADSNGNVRGYADNTKSEITFSRPGKLNVGAYTGNCGTIAVSRYDLKSGQTFTGNSELVNGEIGDDFANYLLKSEQIASAVGLGVWISPDNSITTAGGFIAMALPGCPDTSIDVLERNINTMNGVTDILLSSKNDPEALLQIIMQGLTYKITGSKKICFGCNCNYERIMLILRSLPVSDLEHLLQDEYSEMFCNFCNEQYLIPKANIAAIISEKNK